MKVLPRPFLVKGIRLLLAMTVPMFGQTIEVDPIHENCGSNYNCTATYSNGAKLYVFPTMPAIIVFGADGTRLTVGDWFGSQTGTITDQSYADTSQSPNVSYEVLSFSGASVSQAGVLRGYTGSGTVAYAYTRTCKPSKSAEGGGCMTHLITPMAVKYTF